MCWIGGELGKAIFVDQFQMVHRTTITTSVASLNVGQAGIGVNKRSLDFIDGFIGYLVPMDYVKNLKSSFVNFAYSIKL